MPKSRVCSLNICSLGECERNEIATIERVHLQRAFAAGENGSRAFLALHSVFALKPAASHLRRAARSALPRTPRQPPSLLARPASLPDRSAPPQPQPRAARPVQAQRPPPRCRPPRL
eukprot:5857759-Pleurochrysis_carterae.AAC.1